MSADNLIAERGAFALRGWLGGKVLLVEAGDDLNEPKGLVLSPDTLRWLITTGGPAALHAIGGAPQIKTTTNPRCANG